jgi:hypothetical protein
MEFLMLRNALFFCILVTVSSPLLAQDWNEIAYYQAFIGPEDMRNSNGQRVTTLGGVLQQDRANFHRFGIRHSQDQSDPVFGDRGLRAGIPQMVIAGGGDGGTFAQMARNGQPFLIGVFVCGYGRTPSVLYLADPGGDHSGCV